MRALNHILTHSADFQKPDETRNFLTRLLGAGVLVTEGEQHRQQVGRYLLAEIPKLMTYRFFASFTAKGHGSSDTHCFFVRAEPDHDRFLCIQNPAFGPVQIRGLTPIFNDISLKVISVPFCIPI